MKRTIIAGLILLCLGGITGQARQEAAATQHRDYRQEAECRYKHRGTTNLWTYQKIVLTIECASEALNPIGGTAKALDVFACESGWAIEPAHSDSYHGQYQYLRSTFHSQQAMMPTLVNHYDLPQRVHSPRANVITAIGWARRSWTPWSCS